MRFKYLKILLAVIAAVFSTSCHDDDPSPSSVKPAEIIVNGITYTYSVPAGRYHVGETLKMTFNSNSNKGIAINFMDENILITTFPYEYTKKLTKSGSFPIKIYSSWEIVGDIISVKGEVSSIITITVTD